MRKSFLRQCFQLAAFLAGIWLAFPGWAEQPKETTAEALELTDYQHFVIYPHLHKALQAQAEQNAKRAVQEFSLARERAPDSIPLMLFLTEAYRHFGLDEQARLFLREQLTRFPDEPRLLRQLAAIPLDWPEITTLAQLRQQQKHCMEEVSPACRLYLAYGALEVGELQLAEEQLISAELKGKKQAEVLQQAIIERALHLQKWDYLDTYYRNLQAAGELSAAEFEQWFQVLLAAGLYSELIESGTFGGADWQIRLGNHLLEHEPLVFATYMQRPAPQFVSPEQEIGWIYLLSQAAESRQLLRGYQAQYTENRQRLAADWLPSALARQDRGWAQELLDMLPADQYLAERFAHNLAKNDLPQAARISERIFNSSRRGVEDLEQHSWRLLRSGASAEAANVLLQHYPFSGSLEMREQLLVRLSELLATLEYPLSQNQLQRLQRPLIEPRLREVQVQSSWMRHDCQAIVRVLSDRTQDYTAATWLRLADCQKEMAPGLAVDSYELAAQLDTSPATRIALAYQYYAVEAWQEALEIWLDLPLDQLNDTHLQAATHTALQASASNPLEHFLAEQKRRGLDNTATYWLLLATHLYPEEPEQAREAIEQSLQLEPLAQAFILQAQIDKSAGRLDAALAGLQQAMVLEPDNLQYKAALGYLLWEMQDYTGARQAHEQALAGTPTDMAQRKQLVYLNERLDNREGVQQHGRIVIDDLYLLTERPWSAEPEKQDIAELFGFRRMHEESKRYWTFNFDASLGLNNNSVGARPIGTTGSADNNYRSFAQFEADYQLGKNKLVFGDQLSVFTRVYTDSASSSTSIPDRNPVAGAGIRWKPWYDRVVFASLEQLQPLRGNDSSDTLARLSASFFNGGRFSDDWHPLGRGWLAQNLYLDAGYYMRKSARTWTADYRISWHHKLREGQTLEPYTHVQQQGYRGRVQQQGDRDSKTRGAQIWGVGLRWNLWARQTRHDAWPHKYSVGLEHQTILNTVGQKFDRRNSCFLVLGARW